MTFLQIKFYLLRSVFQEITLNMRWINIVFHLPNKVNVIGHDDKAINKNPTIIYQKSQAINDDFFVLILNQQFLPLQNCGCEKLRMFSDHESQIICQVKI